MIINFQPFSSSSIFKSLCAYTFLFIMIIIVFPTSTVASSSSSSGYGCSCDLSRAANSDDPSEALRYKLGSMASVLITGGLGVSLPFLSKKIPSLRPENDMFFMVKAFAAGVILATGFVHILPEAFESLNSPCLIDKPWHKFPFAGFIAMMSSIGTLMVDSLATGYYKRRHFNSSSKLQAASRDEEKGDNNNIHNEHADHIHVHTHSTHGHAHGSAQENNYDDEELIRHRIISQVLEMGIVMHSVIIGVSLGAAGSIDAVN